MAATPKLTRERKTNAELRALFNKLIQPKIDAKLYKLKPFKSAYPPSTVLLPAGTKSTMYDILDENGTIVAKCHAYVLASGKIGGSGKLDPKYVRDGNTTYVLGP